MEKKQSPKSSPDREPMTATLVASLILFAFTTALALNQSPRPYPLTEPTAWQSFASPREQNAFLRLPLFSGAIRDLHVLAGSNLVWAVGDNGLVLHSTDGGISWQRQLLRREASANGGEQAPEATPGSESAAMRTTAPPQLFSQAVAADAPAANEYSNPPLNIPDNNALPSSKEAEKKQDLIQTTKQQQIDKQQALSQQQQQQQQAQQQQEEPPAQQQETPLQIEQPPTISPRQATPQSLQPLANLNTVWFFNDRIGVVAGDQGTIYRTVDGGANWQVVAAPSNWTINHLFKAADDRLYAALDAAIIYSTDQGSSWSGGQVTRRIVEKPVGWLQRSPGRSSQPLVSGDGASLYQYSNAGDMEPLGAALSLSVALRHAVGSEDYWLAVGDRGAIVRGTESGAASINSPTDKPLHRVVLLSKTRALAVGENGVTLDTQDAGLNWSTLEPVTNQTLLTLAALDEDTLLAAGNAGTLLRSEDGGNSWHYVVTSAAVLASEYGKRHPGQQLRYNGGQFQVAPSGSDNWQTLSYQRSPATWFWVACGYFLLVAVGIAIRKRQVVESKVQTVADILASDRPLGPGDPDPLQFGAIARGLSRFMRNPKTEPPLTVAITGAWGTGKSSLMNLLHHDLKTYGFTPVWFNAWHHQKGEQLLASLYANIRSQAVPGWFSFPRGVPIGLLFRFNLLFRRSCKHWLLSLLLVMIFVAAIVYLQMDMQDDYTGWMSETVWRISHANDLDSLLVVLFGNLAPLLAALRALRAFGLNPENLIAASANTEKSGNRMDPGARQRFARDFNDVASCLELGRMVIFIDDLDRCRQENVVDILEAVNFLAVSGDCYIVIGMDEKWVRVCIENQFSQMVQQGQSGSAFSENYLEKLINIKVPVPTLESDGSSLLLAPEEAKATDSELQQWLQLFWQRYRFLLWMAGIALASIGAGQLAFLLGERLGPNWTLQTQPQAVPIALQQWDNITLQPEQLEDGKLSFYIDFKATANDAIKPADNALQLRLQALPDDLARGVSLGNLGNTGGGLELVLGLATPPASREDSSQQQDKTDARGETLTELKAQQFADGIASRYSGTEILLASVVLLALLAAILFYLLKRQTRIVSDSATFKDALNLWHPWIMINRQTPRAIKRYLNRVRYIAMRYRSEDATATPPLWRRLFPAKSAEAAVMDEDFLDEAQLVALSAIFSVDEQWLGDEEKFAQLANGKLATLLSQKFQPKKIGLDEDTKAWQVKAKQLQEALDNHIAEYGDSFLQQDARRKFLKVVTATAFS